MAKEEKAKPMATNIENVEETSISKKQLELQASRGIANREQKRKNLVHLLMAEKKVPVVISPFYAAYLGRVVSVLVNGIAVAIPANGRTYMINETHANEATAKIRRIDKLIARQKKAGDIQNNYESQFGELQI